MEFNNLMFVAMVTTLTQKQKYLQVLFRSLHLSTKSQLQGFIDT